MHGDFHGNLHHIEGIGADPARTIGLLQLHFSGEMKAAVEYTYIIQSKEASFKDVVSVYVFTVDPPGKIDQQFMKYFFEKADIACSCLFLLDIVYLHCSPSLHRRIYITEIPFVGR